MEGPGPFMLSAGRQFNQSPARQFFQSAGRQRQPPPPPTHWQELHESLWLCKAAAEDLYDPDWSQIGTEGSDWFGTSPWNSSLRQYGEWFKYAAGFAEFADTSERPGTDLMFDAYSPPQWAASIAPMVTTVGPYGECPGGPPDGGNGPGPYTELFHGPSGSPDPTALDFNPYWHVENNSYSFFTGQASWAMFLDQNPLNTNYTGTPPLYLDAQPHPAWITNKSRFKVDYAVPGWIATVDLKWDVYLGALPGDDWQYLNPHFRNAIFESSFTTVPGDWVEIAPLGISDIVSGNQGKARFAILGETISQFETRTGVTVG